MKLVKKILGFVAAGLFLLVLLLGVFLFYTNFSDYAPLSKEKLRITAGAFKSEITGGQLSLITWNIGYAGLGKEMDFFYDGGKSVMASREKTENWLQQIVAFVAKKKHVDFLLFQEVDLESKRSYYIDESIQLESVLPAFDEVTAINYQVPFVPVPLGNPMGRVKAGMMSFSAYSMRQSTRHAYPQIASWPDRMFLLDRCFIESRIKIENGFELVLLNTHNSAFIDDPKRMQLELETIRKLMLAEFEKGNYVIAGGDWNMNPPDFRPVNGYGGHRFEASPVHIPTGFMPEDWQYAYDASLPSNRQLNQPYLKKVTGSTTIDFFILSPNVQVSDVQVIDLGFEQSDHQPVYLEVYLN